VNRTLGASLRPSFSRSVRPTFQPARQKLLRAFDVFLDDAPGLSAKSSALESTKVNAGSDVAQHDALDDVGAVEAMFIALRTRLSATMGRVIL